MTSTPSPEGYSLNRLLLDLDVSGTARDLLLLLDAHLEERGYNRSERGEIFGAGSNNYSNVLAGRRRLSVAKMLDGLAASGKAGTLKINVSLRDAEVAWSLTGRVQAKD